MSPARAKTTDEAIVDAAARLLEAGGLDGLTMQAVAAEVGVRAPSLYKRFRDRAALVRAVQEGAAIELGATLERVAAGTDPRAVIVAMADEFRDFAHHRPGVYGLLFAALPDEMRVAPEANEAAVRPLIDALAALRRSHGGQEAGDDVLDAARLLVAFAHGFVTMEAAGAFRLGGDVERAWRSGVVVIVDAVAAGRTG